MAVENRQASAFVLTRATRPILIPTLAMFVHAVYFWLLPDLTPPQRAQFAAGVRSLGAIESVQQCYIGVPAATDRPVIERSYDQSLVLVFADQAAHDAYQVHPVHERFRAECGGFWTTVRIFDSVSEVSQPVVSSR